MKKILTLLLALILLVGCGKTNTNKETNKENKTGTNTEQQSGKTYSKEKPVTVKLGIMGTESKTWSLVASKVKDKGINLEIVGFDSYRLPNAALNDKQIDLNAFQHHIYLDNEVKDLGYKITSIGDTSIAPLGLYSKQIKNLNELKDGSKIAIPDDVSNGGRALKLIEAAGLIKVKPEAGLLPTIKDITENPKNLQIVEFAAVNIPPVLDEIPLAAINSGIAVDSGYKYEDALFLEQIKAEGGKVSPYTNLIAARTAEKDRPEFKEILDAYYTKEVKDLILKESNGGSIPVWEPKDK